MTQEEIKQFKARFKSIVYQKGLITAVNNEIGKLSRWDNNGSHKAAIEKRIEQRKGIRQKLTELLAGYSYEEWKTASIRISMLLSDLKRTKYTSQKTQQRLDDFTFTI